LAISEAQLETWSQQGKTGQFTDTYNSIRGNLLDASAPYPVKNVEVYLQGSYGNATNVWADSDVDVVLCHTGAFYYDISGMNQAEQDAFTTAFSGNAAYGYTEFKMQIASSHAYTMAWRPVRRRSIFPGRTVAATRTCLSASSFGATTRMR